MSADLNAEEIRILRHIEAESFRGGGPRIADGPERRRLKRLGLIESGPANRLGFRGSGGDGRRWHLAEAGREKVKGVGS